MTATVDESKDELNDTMPKEAAETDTSPSSPVFLLAKRLLFPTLALVFAILYINNTWGEIRFQNLWYPYFIISCIMLLLSSIYFSEIKETYKNKAHHSATIRKDIQVTYQEWKLSIWVATIAVIYLFSIEYIGFFLASFATMAAMMRVSGIKNWRVISLVCIGTLAFVYVMFIMVLGISPPSGPIEVI